MSEHGTWSITSNKTKLNTYESKLQKKNFNGLANFSDTRENVVSTSKTSKWSELHKNGNLFHICLWINDVLQILDIVNLGVQ